uniref:Ovule protein n=1 Tax=Heterorhabditis bacteriophora TaxID=37862 RepID=A0A1I7WN96_HETBA
MKFPHLIYINAHLHLHLFLTQISIQKLSKRLGIQFFPEVHYLIRLLGSPNLFMNQSTEHDHLLLNVIHT